MSEKTYDEKVFSHVEEGLAMEKWNEDIHRSSSSKRLLMYYLSFMRNKEYDTDQIYKKLEKALEDETIKKVLELQLKQKTQQFASDSIELYAKIEHKEKIMPVQCIKHLWDSLKELAESEKHWEKWIYKKIQNIAEGRPVLQKIVAIILGIAIGFSGDFLHDMVQEKYFQPEHSTVNDFYVINGNWNVEIHVNRGINLDGKRIPLATDSDASIH